ncbi:carbohydrate esterase family protein [Salix suchowensis]|nr:carbohydrate esterase family protein [Salix suchowensis]
MFGRSSRFFRTANTNRVFRHFFSDDTRHEIATTTLLFAPLLVAADSAYEDLRLARHAKIARQAPTPASAPPPSPPATTTPPVVAIPPPPAVSLLSTNPTAVPLTQIVAGQPSPATIPLATTYTAGTVPSGLPEAPGLPSRASNTTNCWWTCGGCTREDDITSCPDKMTWGLTYDDGPAFYTPNLLQYLAEQKIKSTFFTVGSRVISAPATLQAMHVEGHQISVHTWAHPPLTTLTNDEIIAELGWSRKAIKDVLGVTPNTFRPPYGDIDDRVRAIAKAMGMVPVLWTRIGPYATFDTDDFNINGGITTVQQVLVNWKNILGNATSMNTGFIVLEHDLFPQAVEAATGYILPDAIAHQPPFKIEPVITCLNKPLRDAYVETNDNKTNPPVASGGAVGTLSSGAPVQLKSLARRIR